MKKKMFLRPAEIVGDDGRVSFCWLSVNESIKVGHVISPNELMEISWLILIIKGQFVSHINGIRDRRKKLFVRWAGKGRKDESFRGGFKAFNSNCVCLVNTKRERMKILCYKKSNWKRQQDSIGDITLTSPGTITRILLTMFTQCQHCNELSMISTHTLWSFPSAQQLFLPFKHWISKKERKSTETS